MSAPAEDADASEIRRALALIVEPGSVVELRIPKAGRAGVVSGYFDHPGPLAAAVARWSGRTEGVYVTLNPCVAALLARAANRVVERAHTTTGDADVLRRRWLLIDLDPRRPAGISSTEDEHAAALGRARDVRAWLAEHGWPTPALADSGNGAHLLYRIDLPNATDSTALVRRVLEALAFVFDDDTVTIDTGVFNAGRISKVYGTLAAKGDSMPDRPHRLARVLDAPTEPMVVPLELLAALADLVPLPPPAAAGPGRVVNLDAALAAAGHDVVKRKAWNGGTVYELRACPFNREHARTARVVSWSDGRRTAGCFHESCRAHTWPEWRAALGLGAASGNGQLPGAPRTPTPPAAGVWAAGRIAAEELATSDRPRDGAVLVRLADVAPQAVTWVWPGRVARGKLTLLVGDPGLGKSFLTLDVGARCTRGGAWPDDGAAPRGDVILLSAEDGAADTLRPRLDALGADVTCVHLLRAVRVGDTERTFSLAADVRALEDAVAETRAVLVVIDPVSAYLGKTDSYKDSEVRGLLAPLAGLAERTGAAVLAVMHLTKDAQRRALYRPGGSIAFTAAARVVLALAKAPDDEERRVLVSVKNNLGPPALALAFRIAAREGGGPVTEWESLPVEGVDADSLLTAAGAGEEREERRQAVALLRELLVDGERLATEVVRAAREAGISERTLRRARTTLGVRVRRAGEEGRRGGGAWRWALPPALNMATPCVPGDVATLIEPGDHSSTSIKVANPAAEWEEVRL